jgi:hypothetical protein
MYENFDVYGPYTRKDGRQHIILYDGIQRKTVSYPKYLMECYLNRYLKSDETVHHKDEDFTNNDINNLEILIRAKHSSLHNVGHFVELNCSNCKTLFTLSLGIFNQRFKRSKSGDLFCSTQCDTHKF